MFFRDDTPPVLIALETAHPETELFGQRVFEMDEAGLIELMKKNGLEFAETEDEAWGERRLSFDDAMIDFYFEDGKLNTVNWSVIVDEDDDE